MSIMKYSVPRYDVGKKLITVGILTINDLGTEIALIYKDSEIEVEASASNHPISALENLRQILESKYSSLIACNGCRCDTSYRATGGFGTYQIVQNKPAVKTMNIFEPTSEIDKLCTVVEHKAAYARWLNSLS